MNYRSHLRQLILRSAFTLVSSAAFALAVAPLSSASAYTYKALHAFCKRTTCPDGDRPTAGLLRDASGNLYGTTNTGGKYGGGVVFKMVPNGDGTYSYYVIRNFCSRANCTDGANPRAGVIMAADGDLFGTTSNGGKYNFGVLFELTHGTNGWTWKVIHSFGGGSDGEVPIAGLTYLGQQSNGLWDENYQAVFGALSQGAKYGNGAIYELYWNGSSWTYKVIHNTNSGVGPNELAMDSSGNLFGTTYGGGTYGSGLLYKLASGTWKPTTLYQFCSSSNCTDGSFPIGRLWIDDAGDLFGTTVAGGTGPHTACTLEYGGCGVAFERTAGGTYKVLYNFCSLTSCADGYNPYAGLVMDSSGHLYGTTEFGVPNACGNDNLESGTVFELASNNGNWSQSTLYSFCSQANDGFQPDAPVIVDGSGDLLGTTYYGGSNDDGGYGGGTVFQLTP